MSGEQPVLLLGASVRALAESALRAGLHPICADQFADLDLRQFAEVIPVDDYLNGLLPALCEVPQMPWIYTGGLENHPDLLQRLIDQRGEEHLLGNSSDVLGHVNDPQVVHSAIRNKGINTPEYREATESLPKDGTWLIKPDRGCGGRGIAIWEDDQQPIVQATQSEPHFFQRRIAGESISAVFVAWAGEAEVVGVTRQLVGETWLHTAPFVYCGSIGPIMPEDSVLEQIAIIGETLAKRFGLRGLFGCDLIHNRKTGEVWFIELNPRYTASVEVLELGRQDKVLREHSAACFSFQQYGPFLDEGPESDRENDNFCANTPVNVIGKAILFAPQEIHIDDWPVKPGVAKDVWDVWNIRPVADIPMPGTTIPKGGPVCTLFVRETDPESALETLKSKANQLLQRLFDPGRSALD